MIFLPHPAEFKKSANHRKEEPGQVGEAVSEVCLLCSLKQASPTPPQPKGKLEPQRGRASPWRRLENAVEGPFSDWEILLVKTVTWRRGACH